MPSPRPTDILLVGSGGREHALAWKLRRSPHCGRLLAAPGNPGIAAEARCLPIPATDLDRLTAVATEERVGLVVVGPEVPLAAGLADRLAAEGVPVFGPRAAAARIESSKAFARTLMARAGVAQPEHALFTEQAAALRYLDGLAERGAAGAVVKASGLAAGKGALVCDTLVEARAAAAALLEGRLLGEAGREIVIEERLHGEEVSVFALTDGERMVLLPPAQDYKRACDGNSGPNTGGMGSHAPAPLLTPALMAEARERILRPVLRELAAAGSPFTGCLYAGLMQTDRGLRVIEFNCRFGDPETQAVLPLLDADLLELLLAAATGRLDEGVLPAAGAAVTVVVASAGYPGEYPTGHPIEGLDEAARLPGVTLFHAGTALREGRVVTAGGRVVGVTGQGDTFAAARETAYAAVERIRFAGAWYRRDIARHLAG